MKLTLEIPEGLARVLAIEAAIRKVSTEQACVLALQEMIEGRLELPEFYNGKVAEIYQSGRRRRKVATR